MCTKLLKLTLVISGQNLVMIKSSQDDLILDKVNIALNSKSYYKSSHKFTFQKDRLTRSKVITWKPLCLQTRSKVITWKPLCLQTRSKVITWKPLCLQTRSKVITWKPLCLQTRSKVITWKPLCLQTISKVITWKPLCLQTRSKVITWKPLCLHKTMTMIQHHVIKFVSDLRQVCGFLQVLWFPPQIKLTTTI